MVAGTGWFLSRCYRQIWLSRTDHYAATRTEIVLPFEDSKINVTFYIPSIALEYDISSMDNLVSYFVATISTPRKNGEVTSFPLSLIFINWINSTSTIIRKWMIRDVEEVFITE